MVKQDSLARSGLEIYKTTDKNIEPEPSSDDEEKEGFVLQNGTITEIAYFNEMFSNSFEYDYEDISSNGSISLPEVDDTRFYKGKKILLKKAWEEPGKTLTWDDLENVLLGFITEQSYSENGVELKIAGMTKLLDQKKEFSFTKTKRSKILKAIIEASGLKANISTKGLNDDVINYTNVSSSGSSGSSGDADLDKWVKETIGNETDDLKKAEKVHYGLCKALTYTDYSCSKYSTVSECWKSKKLNCANTSMVSLAALKSAGLSNSQIVHGPNHFWTIVVINGKEYAVDPTSKQRKFNEVWNGLKYSTKCGDTPSC